MLLTLAAAGVAAYAALVGGLYAFQRNLLYLPDTSRPQAASAGVPDLREATIGTADGLRLLAWFVPPSAPGRPTIAYFHGNAGHIGYRAERLRRFAAEGFGVLMLEYRGYGGNPGKPSEDGLVADGRAALDFLAAQGIAPERIVLYGESLGSGVAVRLGSERPTVAVLLLECPYDSLVAAAKRHYAYVPVDFLLKDRFDSARWIRSVRAPVLVMHGEHDTIVPVEAGRALFAAASEPKEIWVAPEAGHNDLSAHGALETAIDFIRRRVAGAG